MKRFNLGGSYHVTGAWDDTVDLVDEPRTPEDACLQGAPMRLQQDAPYSGTITGTGLGSLYPRPRSARRRVAA